MEHSWYLQMERVLYLKWGRGSLRSEVKLVVKPHEKLARSLSVLLERQGDGRHVFRSAEFFRDDRERLLRSGYLLPITRGWLMLSNPGSAGHDTTPWYASFWEFCARYSTHRFGEQWHLSPELSLLRHAENTTVPQQIVVHSAAASNNLITLPFGTSLFDLKVEHMPSRDDICERDGVRLYTTEAALLRVPASFYRDHPLDARTVLGGVADVGGVARRLLSGSHSKVAGRLAGAFRHVGRQDIADGVRHAMLGTGHRYREVNPFLLETSGTRNATSRPRSTSPLASRLQALWERAREPILTALPRAPGLPTDDGGRMRYLEDTDSAYGEDAYHSLSIEGYRVTPELIERVQGGAWDPGGDAEARQQRDALAARGYWQAYQAVRSAVGEILYGADAAGLFRRAHRNWYFQLFEPFVAAGVYQAAVLADYRNQPVYLRGSRYVPPRADVVVEGMEALAGLLEQEESPAVRAVAGHWLFGYVHPYPDGNGRLARFLMNAMLASGGYPWTTIRVEDRDAYMSALETASVRSEISPFAELIAGYLESSRRPVGPEPGRATGAPPRRPRTAEPPKPP